MARVMYGGVQFSHRHNVDAFHLHKALAADPHRFVVQGNFEAIADLITSFINGGNGQTLGLGGIENRAGNRVGLATFSGRGIGEHFGCRPTIVGMDLLYLRLFQRQGAGFVKDDGVNRLQQFERTGIFDQHPILGGQAQEVQHTERPDDAQVIPQ